ncbi:MAG: YbaB/EbfC family nucleoid-associated protein [Endomicrobiia bacterium]
MFDKIKQAKQLLELQAQLKKEKAESEKNGVKVVINGKLEVEEIFLNPSLEIKKQEELLKDCFNDVIKKMQMKLAQKMAGMPGLGF